MRTTVTFEDDVAAALERLRRARHAGISQVVNDLVRAGLTAERQTRQPFTQSTSEIGLRIDVTDVAEALEFLEGPDHR
ncbi:MAG: CopG family transcriptional regulator [Actinomycetota bacterium]